MWNSDDKKLVITYTPPGEEGKVDTKNITSLKLINDSKSVKTNSDAITQVQLSATATTGAKSIFLKNITQISQPQQQQQPQQPQQIQVNPYAAMSVEQLKRAYGSQTQFSILSKEMKQRFLDRANELCISESSACGIHTSKKFGTEFKNVGDILDKPGRGIYGLVIKKIVSTDGQEAKYTYFKLPNPYS